MKRLPGNKSQSEMVCCSNIKGDDCYNLSIILELKTKIKAQKETWLDDLKQSSMARGWYFSTRVPTYLHTERCIRKLFRHAFKKATHSHIYAWINMNKCTSAQHANVWVATRKHASKQADSIHVHLHLHAHSLMHSHSPSYAHTHICLHK